MGKNPLPQSIVTPNFTGIGPPSRVRIHTRASELAGITGRATHQVSPPDCDYARRELTADPDVDLQETQLVTTSESIRRDLLPASGSHEAPESPDEDGDDAGRNDNSQLFADDADEAAHDQMPQAARISASEKSTPDQP